LNSAREQCLLAVTHDLLASLCEELHLNCSPGRISEEAPLALDAVRRAANLLREEGHSLPERAFDIAFNAPAAATTLN
jgi:hypothetical protein